MILLSDNKITTPSSLEYVGNSKTSSTKEFLDSVKPQYAIIGVGKNNKFQYYV